MTNSGGYFLTEAEGKSSGHGRFVTVADIEPVSFKAGLTFQPVLGEAVLVNHVHFDPHVEAPTHVHVEEQIVVVVEGELEFWIEDERRTMRSGDMAVIPPWVPHGARTHDSGCLEIDVFQPPRRQLLALLRPDDANAEG